MLIFTAPPTLPLYSTYSSPYSIPTLPLSHPCSILMLITYPHCPITPIQPTNSYSPRVYVLTTSLMCSLGLSSYYEPASSLLRVYEITTSPQGWHKLVTWSLMRSSSPVYMLVTSLICSLFTSLHTRYEPYVLLLGLSSRGYMVAMRPMCSLLRV
ncbi:hypothetical protein BJ165DRAFT_1502812 [Panaeolus papilionaceus]|nr:hypothetical protein BJ165DRAFT_1502812 [Panaeolus papilionaceus]